MSPLQASRPWQPVVARADGFALASAAEVVVKGLLECEPTLSALFLPRARFSGGCFRAVQHESAQAALGLNRFRLEDTIDAARALALLREERAAGRPAAAFVPNASLNTSFASLRSLATAAAGRQGAGHSILLLEDDAEASPNTCPRRVARRLRLPMLEPATLERVPEVIDAALTVSAMTASPCAVILHRSLLAGYATIEMHANRLVSSEDQAAWLLERTRPRIAQAGDALAVIRRLELNRPMALPSPGQRERLGLLAIGASAAAVAEMLESMGMAGRVPVLYVESVSPIDDALVQRFLERCDHAIVVEPRPGSVAPRIVGIAQRARRESRHAGQVWWDELPPIEGADRTAEAGSLQSTQATRGSMLARVLEPFLSASRGAALDVRLEPTPPWAIGVTLAPRGESFSESGAVRIVEQALRDVTLVHDDGSRASTLGFAVTGLAAEGIADPVPGEVMGSTEFLDGALALCRQLSMVGTPRLTAIVDLPSEADRNVTAIAKSIAEAVGRIEVCEVDLKDRAEIESAAGQALLRDRPTLMVVRDAPPARRDPTLLRSAAAEIDRLGHAPMERLVWPTSTLCAIRPELWEQSIAEGLELGEEGLAREARVSRQPTERRGLSARVAPLAEQVEVRRSRAPSAYARGIGRRFPPPTPLHANDPVWRAHCAGCRGDAPGVAARLIAEAGRSMGYRVSCLHDETPIGPGRSAWTQLIFTRLESPKGDRSHAEIPGASIPFGEASLFLGLEPEESLRGLGADPSLRPVSPTTTCSVVNTAWLGDQRDRPEATTAQLGLALAALAPGGRVAGLPYAQLARWGMLTDRMLDVVLVGVAFQRGWIPLSVSALELAARRLEARGWARTLEALTLGRTLAEATGSDAIELGGSEPPERLARRAVQDMRRRGRGGRVVARRLERLFGRVLSVAAIPDGSVDQVRLGAVVVEAVERAAMTSDVAHATRLVAAIEATFAVDGDTTDRRFAREAIVPVCEAFLPRDAIAIAAIAGSALHRRRLRDVLDVRSAVGDEVERRFLVQLDFSIAGTRWRTDMRTSDWPLKALEAIGRRIPFRLRCRAGADGTWEAIESILARAKSEPAAIEGWIGWASRFNQLMQARVHESAGAWLPTATDLEALTRPPAGH